MDSYSHKELGLRDILRVIFRHKLVIIACLITIMIAVYIGMELRTPVYNSQVSILVTGTMQKDLETARNLGPGSLILTQMELVRSNPILERTVEALKLHQRPLGYEKGFASRVKKLLIERDVKQIEQSLKDMTPEARRIFLFNRAMVILSGNIRTFLQSDSSIFVIGVSDYNPTLAGIIANVLSRSYVIFDLEQQIAELRLTYGDKNETIVKLVKHIEALQETLDGRILPDIEAIDPATVKIITQAGYGLKAPMRPSKTSALLAAFVISMVLGVSLAFIFDFFDQTFKTPDEVEKFLNIPALGSIPRRKAKDKLTINHDNPATRYTQLLHNLSNRIYLSMKDQNLKSILLTDAEGSIELPLITAEIGICLSHQSEFRVLIIDADLRNPSLHKNFNISDSPGLTDVLEGKIPFEDAVRDLGSNLAVLAAGYPESNPLALLDSSMMSDVIKKAEHYEIVIIKCADIKNYSDAIILSSFTDTMALVINEGRMRRQIVENAIAPIKQRKINILGAVINNHKYVIPEIIYRLT